MIDKEAIEIMKDWIRYEKANKDRINKADELIKIQETVLRIIDKKDNEIKEIKRASNAKEDFYKTYMEENKKLKEELEKYKEMYAVSVADRVNSAFKQEYKNNEDLEMLYKGCQIELEEKDKRISNLEFALMDMVLQFADENKDSINTMGLSALEIAFSELEFDNPISIKEVHKRYKELAQKYYQ